MDKLGGTCIVHLLHHADMWVSSKAFPTSPAGHTSEHHQWAGGDYSVVGIHLRHHRRKWVNSDDYGDNGVLVAVPFTSTSQNMHLNTVTNVKPANCTNCHMQGS